MQNLEMADNNKKGEVDPRRPKNIVAIDFRLKGFNAAKGTAYAQIGTMSDYYGSGGDTVYFPTQRPHSVKLPEGWGTVILMYHCFSEVVHRDRDRDSQSVTFVNMELEFTKDSMVILAGSKGPPVSLFWLEVETENMEQRYITALERHGICKRQRQQIPPA